MKKQLREQPQQFNSLESVNSPILPKRLNPDIVALLTERLSDEFTAHYFYMCAGNWCNNAGYFKAGKFFLNESDDELNHAKGIQNYLVQWNIQPSIPQVQTQHEIQSLVDVINKAYTLEYNLYTKYNENSKVILVKDVATFDFLEGYREIQNKSVAEYSDLLNVLQLIDTKDKYQILYFENHYFN